MTGFAHKSRSKLTHRDLGRFPSESLFDRIARAVCEAECLPRKELYESWEVARRARRRMRGGDVWDLAAGHGLLAWMLLLLDDSSERAHAVDRKTPPSAARLDEALVEAWPRLRGRLFRVEGDLSGALPEAGALVVSAHACGSLSDRTLDVALRARARVAVLPCCHALRENDTGGLSGWMEGSLAVDATRAARLRHAGYAVHTQTIPEAITPKNRLLLGWPEGTAGTAG